MGNNESALAMEGGASQAALARAAPTWDDDEGVDEQANWADKGEGKRDPDLNGTAGGASDRESPRELSGKKKKKKKKRKSETPRSAVAEAEVEANDNRVPIPVQDGEIEEETRPAPSRNEAAEAPDVEVNESLERASDGPQYERPQSPVFSRLKLEDLPTISSSSVADSRTGSDLSKSGRGRRSKKLRSGRRRSGTSNNSTSGTKLPDYARTQEAVQGEEVQQVHNTQEELEELDASVSTAKSNKKKERNPKPPIKVNTGMDIAKPQVPTLEMTTTSEEIEQTSVEAERNAANRKRVERDDVSGQRPAEEEDVEELQDSQASSIRRKKKGKERAFDLEEDPISDEVVDVPSSVRPLKKRPLPATDKDGGRRQRKKKRALLQDQVEDFESNQDPAAAANLEVVEDTQENQDDVLEVAESQLPGMSFPDPEAESIMEQLDPDLLTSDAVAQSHLEETELDVASEVEPEHEDISMQDPPSTQDQGLAGDDLDEGAPGIPALNSSSEVEDSHHEDLLSDAGDKRPDLDTENFSNVENDRGDRDNSESKLNDEGESLPSSPPEVNSHSSQPNKPLESESGEVQGSGHLHEALDNEDEVQGSGNKSHDLKSNRTRGSQRTEHVDEPGGSRAKAKLTTPSAKPLVSQKSSKRKPKIPYFQRPDFQNPQSSGEEAENENADATTELHTDQVGASVKAGSKAKKTHDPAVTGPSRSARNAKKNADTPAAKGSARVASKKIVKTKFSSSNPFGSTQDLNEEEGLTSSQRQQYRNGRLTDAEQQQVQAAVEHFQEAYGLTHQELVELVHRRPQGEDGENARKLWLHVTNSCPTRSERILKIWCRLHFHNYVGRGVWTEDQDDELQRMIDLHGKKWTVIGKLINRAAVDVRNRWRDHLICRDSKVKFYWTEKEEQQLLEIVADCLQDIRRLREEDTSGRFASKTDEELVDWALVSERMGFTRTRMQITEKWKRMREKDQIGEELAGLLPPASSWRAEKARKELRKMTVHDKFLLVRGILGLNVSKDFMIKWKDLNNGLFEKRYERATLVVCWARLKQTVPDHQSKTTEECARYLAEMYEEEGELKEIHEDLVDMEEEDRLVKLAIPPNTPRAPRRPRGSTQPSSSTRPRRVPVKPSAVSSASRAPAVASSSAVPPSSFAVQSSMVQTSPSVRPAVSCKSKGKEKELLPPKPSKSKGREKEVRPASRLSALVKTPNTRARGKKLLAVGELSQEHVGPHDDDTSELEEDSPDERVSTRVSRPESPGQGFEDDSDYVEAANPEGSPELGQTPSEPTSAGTRDRTRQSGVEVDSGDLGIDIDDDHQATHREPNDDPYAITSSPVSASTPKNSIARQRNLFRYGRSSINSSNRKRTRVSESPDMSVEHFKKRPRLQEPEPESESESEAEPEPEPKIPISLSQSAENKKRSNVPVLSSQKPRQEVAESPEAVTEPPKKRKQRQTTLEMAMESAKRKGKEMARRRTTVFDDDDDSVLGSAKRKDREKNKRRTTMFDDDDDVSSIAETVKGKSLSQVGKGSAAKGRKRMSAASRASQPTSLSSDTGEEDLEDIPAVIERR